MRRRLPPLVTVRAFESFSRTGSVRAAAGELAVSHTVVSRHIQNLQHAVGAPLVRKDGRGLKTTREGERFAAKVRRAFDLLEEATGELAHGSGNAIYLSCKFLLARHRLFAGLRALEARLSGVEVILQATIARPDFDKDEANAEVVFLEEPDSRDGLRCELVVRPRTVAVATPEFMRRHPPVSSVADLLQLPLLHETSTATWWETWLHMQGVKDIPRLRGPRLWQGQLMLDAALMGHGVALLTELTCADRLKSGELVEVVPSIVRTGGYYFVAPAAKWNDPALTVVRQWLKETLTIADK